MLFRSNQLFFGMFLHLRQTDKHGRQHREDVCLDECHQNFQRIHENAECHRHHRHRAVDNRTRLHRDEDNGHQTEHGRMSCHDVGKQTDHEGERFGENSEKFHERHNRKWQLQIDGNFRPENLLPVVFCSK